MDTNFEGKLNAAVEALQAGDDLVYIHLEAPDECGHRGEIQNKVKSIEEIDRRVLAPLLERVKEIDDFSLLILPDHPTPLSIRTHSSDVVPYLLYRSKEEGQPQAVSFIEETAAATGNVVERGCDMMKRLLQQ